MHMLHPVCTGKPNYCPGKFPILAVFIRKLGRIEYLLPVGSQKWRSVQAFRRFRTAWIYE